MPLAVAIGVLACLGTGLLTPAEVGDVVDRSAPVLGFLVAATVLAELADRAQLFDVAARAAAVAARGRVPLLFAAVVLLATGCTVLLSLDTTAVLLTPAVLALCAQTGITPWPFALAVVWLANTASLLLPVSNLTNLLAAERSDQSAVEYAAGVAAPACLAVAVTVAVLVLLHGRGLTGRYRPPPPVAVRDRPLLAVASLSCVVLVPLVLLGVPAWTAAGTGAVVLLLVTAGRGAVPWGRLPELLPWRLVLGVLGLFLVVTAVAPPLLDAVLPHGVHGPGQAAVAGAVLANGVDNLPAYLALEPVVPAADSRGLLLGVDLGPLLTPWASLATLLWAQRCRARGLTVSWWRFAAGGTLLVPLLLAVTVPALG